MAPPVVGLTSRAPVVLALAVGLLMAVSGVVVAVRNRVALTDQTSPRLASSPSPRPLPASQTTGAHAIAWSSNNGAWRIDVDAARVTDFDHEGVHGEIHDHAPRATPSRRRLATVTARQGFTVVDLGHDLSGRHTAFFSVDTGLGYLADVFPDAMGYWLVVMPVATATLPEPQGEVQRMDLAGRVVGRRLRPKAPGELVAVTPHGLLFGDVDKPELGVKLVDPTDLSVRRAFGGSFVVAATDFAVTASTPCYLGCSLSRIDLVTGATIPLGQQGATPLYQLAGLQNGVALSADARRLVAHRMVTSTIPSKVVLDVIDMHTGQHRIVEGLSIEERDWVALRWAGDWLVIVDADDVLVWSPDAGPFVVPQIGVLPPLWLGP